MLHSIPALHVFLLACLCLAPGAALGSIRKLRQDSEAAYLEGKAIVISQERNGEPSQRLLGVRTPDGRLVRLQLSDPSQAAGLHTGMDVQATGQWEQPQLMSGGDPSWDVPAAAAGPAAAPAAPRFLAASLSASGAASAAPEVTPDVPPQSVSSAAGPTGLGSVRSTNRLVASRVSAVLIPIAGVESPGRACPWTSLPRHSTAELQRVMFAELAPRNVTVGSTFNKCSYGRTRLTRYNSLVVEPVELPCTGTTYGLLWRFSTCSWDDYHGIADAADEALAARGTDLSQYRHRVYLLPPGPCKSMVGMGFVGCSAGMPCRSWVGPNYWTTPQAIAHELGHNLFMGHAGAQVGREFDEYADETCLMGYCCTDRCPNTPHAWQMGWISVQQLNATTLQPGQTLTTSMYSQSVAWKTGMRIIPNWTKGVPPIFVGYRTKAGGDQASNVQTYGKLHIYTSGITNTFDPSYTKWEAWLGVAGRAWTQPTAGLVVRLVKAYPTSAVLTVCRKGGAETAATCRAGRDNDCNGLAGAKDPACARFFRRRSRRLP